MTGRFDVGRPVLRSTDHGTMSQNEDEEQGMPIEASECSYRLATGPADLRTGQPTFGSIEFMRG